MKKTGLLKVLGRMSYKVKPYYTKDKKGHPITYTYLDFTFNR